MNVRLLSFLLTLSCALPSWSSPRVFAHYMPWYSTKEARGSWGWHWTMGKLNPDQTNSEGLPQIASHDIPLIGPYDSADPDVLKCQVQQMKLAGIEGVILDWYGTRDALDYGLVHQNTQTLIPILKDAGLSFAICYEDQSIGHMVRSGNLRKEDALKEAISVAQWLDEHWFRDPAYLKVDNRPILLAFGPQHLTVSEWKRVFGKLPSQPRIHLLPHLAKSFDAQGCFAWPPVHGGQTLAPEEWKQSLKNLHQVHSPSRAFIPVAFPGFHDFYQEAGLHPSYGYIADRDGATFKESLDLAFQQASDLVQIATWNDYGEGTVIEPTRNHGYRYLEILRQKIDGKPISKSFRNHLLLPSQLLDLKRLPPKSPDFKAKLLQASSFLDAGEPDKAQSLILQLAAASQTPVPSSEGAIPAAYEMAKDIPYRDPESSDDYMKERCRLDVYYPKSTQGFATVVWFHGGGLSAGNRSVPKALMEKGIAVVPVNYRLSPKVQSPAYIQDAAASVAWTLRHIGEYGGDPDRVFVSGHSAGGYLTSMVGFDPQWLKAEGLSPDDLAGLVPFSGHTITHFTVRAEDKIPGTQPTVDALAPLYHVRKDAPPTLLITGDRDLEMLGRYEENAYFWRMLKVIKHPDAELRELKGYDHGGMAEPAFPLLLEFIRQHSKAPSGSR